MLGDRKARKGDDACCKTLMLEGCPEVGGNKLAERWCFGAVAGVEGVHEVKRAVKEVAGVKKWNGVGPSNVFGRGRSDGGFKLHSFQVLNDSIRSFAVAVPERPPTAV